MHTNGNITLIDANEGDIKSIIQGVIAPFQENKSYKLLLKKRVIVNKINGFEINQLIRAKNKNIFNKIFILKKEEDVFLISFFCYKKDVNLYNQLFTEIAYSFMSNVDNDTD